MAYPGSRFLSLGISYAILIVPNESISFSSLGMKVFRGLFHELVDSHFHWIGMIFFVELDWLFL